MNNIQRVEYEEKFKTFIFKTISSIKKSIATIIKTRITIITSLKLIISIIFIKIKIEIDAKKLICYNYNQVNYIKRDYFQSNKKTARIHAMKMNNNDNLRDFQEESSDDSKKD